MNSAQAAAYCPHRLALGTAQFGMNYGVANTRGQVTQQEINAILGRCRDASIECLDTASGYGDSEVRLGRAGVSDMKLISKLGPIPVACSDVPAFVNASVESSLARLGVGCLDGLLLHHPEDLLGASGPAIYDALANHKAEGRLNKIGVSIYGPERLAEMTSVFPLDLVQAPFNIFDQRLLNSGWMSRLSQMGIELHTRSVFLQGLLLMPMGTHPPHFAPWSDAFLSWDKALRSSGSSALEIALGFVLGHTQIERVVVGVDSLANLDEILAVCKPMTLEMASDMASTDVALIEPSRWVFL